MTSDHLSSEFTEGVGIACAKVGANRRQVSAKLGRHLRSSDFNWSRTSTRGDQDAAFVMLERDGSVLATTGPVRSSDARLRRAQALAAESGTALRIERELIDKKLAA